MRTNSIIFVGVLPPPYHGASYVNLSLLSKLGLPFFSFNTAPYIITSKVLIRFSRLLKVLICILLLPLFFKNTIKSYIISLNGNLGLFYDIFFILSLFTKKPICYHHNFTYITKRFVLMRLIAFIVKQKKGSHVFLSKEMKRLYFNKYSKSRCFVISNSLFVPNQVRLQKKKRLYRNIGFLSNLTKEKGTLLFLDLVQHFLTNSFDFYFYLAGPCIDNLILKRIKQIQLCSKRFVYYDAIYDAKKDSFYRNLDFFVFPTQYLNEAEPVTVLEAMSYGLPTFALKQGVIPFMLNNSFLILDSLNFSKQVEEKVFYLRKFPETYANISRSLRQRFLRLKRESQVDFKNLINVLEQK